jgi:hypothetical protein
MNRSKKKILITTYIYYPLNSPRAFRITALARKLAERGHDITVVTADINYDYCEHTKATNVKVETIKTGYLLNKKLAGKVETAKSAKPVNKSSFKRKVKSVVRRSLFYFIPDGHLFEYSVSLRQHLKRTDLNQYDVIISNSHPFAVHLGTALALKNFKNVSIAETGDPHFFNLFKLAPYQKSIESWVLSKFSYITIPVEKALSDYEKLNVVEKVKVIPHGFYFDEVNTFDRNNEISSPISFSFAGRLYKNIRDPSKFLDYLYSQHAQTDYTFTIYTDFSNRESMELLEPYYVKLGSKLIVNPLIPREECIYQLSKSDFLINIANTTANQTPSKLIDYTLTSRPILTVTNDFNESGLFEQFNKGNFDSYQAMDISQFDINQITMQFEELFNSPVHAEQK